MKRQLIFVFTFLTFLTTPCSLLADERKLISGEDQVKQLSYDFQKDVYHLFFVTRAASYFVPKKQNQIILCLRKSLEKQMPVKFAHDMQTLEIVSCIEEE